MTDYTELKQLAEAMKGWELTQCWPVEESESDWEVGGITDGERYPVLTIDTDQYDAAYLAPTIARYYAAAHPAAVLALLAENEALLEIAARATYEAWSQQPGYVPWVADGNSLKQDEARAIVRAALSKGEQP